ncbi:MAG: PDZ domain-containing protein [Candidatus Acidiferrales bacterium]
MNRRNLFFALGLSLLTIPCAGWSAHRAQSTASPNAQNIAAARFAFGGNAAEVPAEFVEGLVFLPVRVNGSQPSLFELDSNAPMSSIDPRRAAELGLPSVPLPSGATASSASEIRSAVITLPGVDVAIPSLPTASKENFASLVGRAYQGTLGNDFLSRVIVEIDYARQTVRLYDPATYVYSGKGASFPLSFSGSMSLIHAKFSLPGQKTREGDFNIDTALNQSVVFTETFAQSHRLFSSHLRTIPDVYQPTDDNKQLLVGRIKTFDIGKYPAEEVIAAFSQSAPGAQREPKIAGAIGGRFLSRFIVTFDFPHQRLFLEPNSHFGDYAETDMSGLSIVARGASLKTFEIVRVEPHTPGAEAGLKKGDIIAAVDDEAAADLTLAELRTLFRQIGHQYKLLIDRNGQTQQITVKMRRLA